MKTFSAKPKDISRQWYLIDASSMPLGRLSTIAASLLLGKGKPTVTPHIDGGDFVVIINADKLKVTGDKEHKKDYYRHSGFPGGLYKRTLGEQAERDSTKIIEHSVRGMLPVNKLRKDRLARLKIFTGSEHAHAGQSPQVYGETK
jgi:large subunit ribosomal protein L13